MNKLILLAFMAVLIAVSVTVPVEVVSRSDFRDDYGNFVSFYRLSDETIIEKRGEIRNAGTPDEELVISGFYYYIAPDGEAQLTEYYADKDGDHKNTTSGPGAVPPRVAATMLG